MSVRERIRRELQRQHLRRQLARRAEPPTRKQGDPLINLNNARRITLLFPADRADDRKAVSRWRQSLTGGAGRVRTIGYFNHPIGATNFDFTALSPANLTWYGTPHGKFVDELLAEPRELLLRLGPPVHPLLDHLARLVPATLRVGPQTPAADNPFHLRYLSEPQEGTAAQLRTIGRIFTFTNAG